MILFLGNGISAMKCPCHSKKEYIQCCGPYHEGESPPNPTALMRSRYSAYALGLVKYIIETTHSEHLDRQLPRDQWKAQIDTFCQATRFLGLEIIEAKGNTVTFRAILQQNGQDVSFTEKSEFAKENGYWFYQKGSVR